MANFMTAEETINEIEDRSDLSDLSDEKDSLFDTDIGDEEDLLSDSNIENDNNDDDNDGDMWSPWRSGSSDLPKFPFIVPNPGIYFPQSPNQELNALQCFLTDELCRNKLCMICNTKEVRKTIVYHCETCSRKPGLRSEKCFKDCHTKLLYK